MAGVADASGDMDRALESATSGARGTAGVLSGPLASAAESAGRVLQNATRMIIDFTKRLMRYALYGLAAVTAAITLFSRQATLDFASYQQGVTNAVTVTGLMGEAFDEAQRALFDFGLEVSLQSAKLPTEIAEAFYGLGSAGLDVAQTMDAARGVIALGEGTMADMGTTTELTLTAMKGFELAVGQTDRIVNALAATISNSMMTVERLAVAFPHAAATAHGFGLSLELTSAALGTLANAGLRAEMTGTGLRSMLAKLSDVSKKGEEVLQKYGLRLEQLDVTSHGFLKVLGLLQRAQMSQTDITKLFGIEAANAAAILIRAGVPALEAFIQKISNTNRAFEMQERQLETLQGRWAIFKSTLQMLRIELAERVGPSMTEWLGKIQEKIEGMLKTQEFKDFKEAIGRVLEVILTKAEGIIEVDLPRWLETATTWLQTLTGTEDSLESWGDAFDRAMIKAELSTLRFVRQLMRWATLAAILGILIPGVRGKAGAAALGGLVGGVAVNRWIADAEKRLRAAEADIAATKTATKGKGQVVVGGELALSEMYAKNQRDAERRLRESVQRRQTREAEIWGPLQQQPRPATAFGYGATHRTMELTVRGDSDVIAELRKDPVKWRQFMDAVKAASQSLEYQPTG